MRVVDHLRQETKALERRLRRLQVEGYDDTDIGGVARDAAALWESALKLSMSGSASRNLNGLTNDLADLGWAQADSLHLVRRVANTDKHEPIARHDADALLAALGELSDGAAAVGTLTPHGHDEVPERARRRRMICAIYEYFHAGETCYQFLAADPDATWMTAEQIDSFEVDQRRSGEIEARLAKLDGYSYDPQEFAALEKSLRESDSELWGVAVFTASYQDVLEIVEPHQHNSDLLPGLHREDEKSALVASSVRAYISGHEQVGSGRAKDAARAIWAEVVAVLRGLPEGVGALQVDRCPAVRFRELAVDAIVVNDALGLLVTRTGVVYVVG